MSRVAGAHASRVPLCPARLLLPGAVHATRVPARRMVPGGENSYRPALNPRPCMHMFPPSFAASPHPPPGPGLEHPLSVFAVVSDPGLHCPKDLRHSHTAKIRPPGGPAIAWRLLPVDSCLFLVSGVNGGTSEDTAPAALPVCPAPNTLILCCNQLVPGTDPQPGGYSPRDVRRCTWYDAPPAKKHCWSWSLVEAACCPFVFRCCIGYFRSWIHAILSHNVDLYGKV